MGRTLRVLTLNCWNINPPFDERMAVLRTAIEALAPDVIGLQEIIVRREGFDQGAVILEGLGYERVFGAGFRWDEVGGVLPHDGDGHGFGNLVAARWPIVASAVGPLPAAEGMERRSVLATVIDTPGGRLPFFTTHLEWRLDRGWVRERQVLAIADFAETWIRDQAAPLPPILTGDLNAVPEATEIRFLCGLASLDGRSMYFQDAWAAARRDAPGHTWDNKNRFAAPGFEPSRRIDYVLVGAPDRDGRGWVEAARVVMETPRGDVFASDHFGVLADVRMFPEG